MVIYVILNKLYTMNLDEYDSEGSAKAVVNHLMETLGLTRYVVKQLWSSFIIYTYSDPSWLIYLCTSLTMVFTLQMSSVLQVLTSQ